MGGSLKAKGFGNGKCRRSHPQAALEAATLPSYRINYDRVLISHKEIAVIGVQVYVHLFIRKIVTLMAARALDFIALEIRWDFQF